MTAIGFLGLGSMGSAIASNLLRQGIDVVVWNRSPERVAPLVALGARAADSAEEALRQPVSISMLANDDAVDQVLTPDALTAAAGCIHLCTASISPGRRTGSSRSAASGASRTWRRRCWDARRWPPAATSTSSPPVPRT
ncbi:NAD(P)-binding domain-containing protein [Nocardioides humi]|uniref:NAD(P)-binding domain-containing protein n=1 Tax=Nocardioides humi TaxID=449461 RepID=UPI001C6425A6|nr:NAD(P)-binding domain-containing protein [Nocardioides humi]